MYAGDIASFNIISLMSNYLYYGIMATFGNLSFPPCQSWNPMRRNSNDLEKRSLRLVSISVCLLVSIGFVRICTLNQ